MTERTQAAADLDARLAEFDRRLREIQADLVPGRMPRQTRPPRSTRGRSGPLAELLQHAPHPQHESQTPPAADAPDLAELAALINVLRQTLDQIEALLERIAAGEREATIAAGPFRTMQEVRDFERLLSSVRGVSDVSVRGYEGAARAIIDVQLGTDG